MKLEIKNSSKGGKGSFATHDIKEGETITVLTGNRVNRKEIHQLIIEGKERLDDPLQIGDDLFLDLDEPSRLINHSCDPNSGLRGESELVAIKDIKQGEELTFDYSATVGKNVEWNMKCLCGSPKCRKTIGNILSIPVDVLKKYNQKGALQDYIKIQIKDLI